MYDVIIIGAGVIGCAIARELSAYEVKACVIEQTEDVCTGTSKANSGIVHAGFDAEPGSLKAKLNLLGNRMMESLAKELDVPFRRNGSMVVCVNGQDETKLKKLYEKGIENGVDTLQLLTREEAFKIEPNLSEDVVSAIYAPTSGIICPFTLTVALAENAFLNGMEFQFDTKVTGIRKNDKGYEVLTNSSTLEGKCIVNAAGVYADVLHNMVSKEKINITARRGDYMLLDKSAGNYVSKTIFPMPDKFGKGVLVSPTIHGNLIVGPTAIDVQDKEAVATTQEGIDYIGKIAGKTVRNLPMRQVITSFAGLRAHEDGSDFIIGEVQDSPGFIDAAGIESPGLSSAPAIGCMVADILRDKLKPEKKQNFIPTRQGIVNPWQMGKEERTAFIRKNPTYGNMICRCEMVSEGEIMDAIKRPIGAKSLDGVKRRVRAGMGRCQAGFCSPRVMEILKREMHTDMINITKSGGDSRLLAGQNKDEIQ